MLYFLHGGHTGPLFVYVKIIFTVSVEKILRPKISIIIYNFVICICIMCQVILHALDF